MGKGCIRQISPFMMFNDLKQIMANPKLSMLESAVSYGLNCTVSNRIFVLVQVTFAFGECFNLIEHFFKTPLVLKSRSFFMVSVQDL